MANGSDERHRHFILEGVTETEAFRSRGGGGRPPIPRRNRAQHGGALLQQVDELRTDAVSAREAQQAAGLEDGLGLQVEFESFPDIQLAFESLARERQGIELLNVRQEGDRTHATVFVPDGSRARSWITSRALSATTWQRDATVPGTPVTTSVSSTPSVRSGWPASAHSGRMLPTHFQPKTRDPCGGRSGCLSGNKGRSCLPLFAASRQLREWRPRRKS